MIEITEDGKTRYIGATLIESVSESDSKTKRLTKIRTVVCTYEAEEPMDEIVAQVRKWTTPVAIVLPETRSVHS